MTELVRYETMCRAISDAYEVDEVKSIRDKAMALEYYARQSKNTEAERQACEIRLRAERRAGELLRDLEKAIGGGTGANKHRGPSSRSDNVTGCKTLAELGVSKQQSSNWQKLASVPQEIFDDELKHSPRPTTNGIIKAGTAPKQNPVDPKALWLWGRLHDFERDLLDAAPSEILGTLTPEMLDDVHRLAPRVANWLKRIGELQ